MGSVNRDTTRRIESVEERSPDPRVNLTQSHFSVGWLRTKLAIGLGLEPNFSWRIIMTVELYYLPGSPYAWRVQLCLEHKGVPYSPKKVDFGGGEAKSDAFLEMNPRSKVPVIRDGSFTLYESAAILEYLEERYPEAKKIYPENLETRAQVRRLICEIDNYWFPPAMLLAQNLYFKSDPAEWNEAEIASGHEALLGELRYVESRVQADSFFGELTAADFALYPFLAHLGRYDMRRPSLGLGDAIGPKTRKLMARIEAQPYFDTTFPPHWK